MDGESAHPRPHHLPPGAQRLQPTPYQLCLDIWGIGFKTADQIALKLGLDPASAERVKAFILYLLEKGTEQGHVFSYQDELEENSRGELGVEEDKARSALADLARNKLVVAQKAGERTAGDY